MNKSIYTRDDLDNAIFAVVPTFAIPGVFKEIGRVSALRSAIVEVFVEWDT